MRLPTCLLENLGRILLGSWAFICSATFHLTGKVLPMLKKHEHDALFEHMRTKFNLDLVVEEDLNAKDKKIGGIMGAVTKRDKDRKARAKRYFKIVGGYDDLEGALANPPRI